MAAGDKVENLMARLRLTAAENAAVVIDDVDDLELVDPDRTFWGKVLSPSVIHLETIKSAMRPAWGNPCGLTLNPAGDNLFVAEFGSKADRDRVMEGSPWKVGKHVVLLKKVDADVSPVDAVFDRLAIWARILKLPTRLMRADRVCASPAELDENCDLPYTAKRLSAENSSRIHVGTSSSNAASAGNSVPGSRGSDGSSVHGGRCVGRGAGRGERMGRSKRFPQLKNLLEAGDVLAVAVEEAEWMPTGSYAVSCKDRSGGLALFWKLPYSVSLRDMGFSGPKYTWSNRQDAQCNIRVRLDRGVANEAFLQMFSDCRVENIITTSSDHYAILISMQRRRSHFETSLQQSFRYEAAWRWADSYADTIRANWAADLAGPNPMHTACAHLKTMAGSLKDWSVSTFGSVRREITRRERSLRSLRNSPSTDRSMAEEKRVQRQLCELFEREEVMDRQRSRVEWLREGDRNPAFFHSKATARRKTNKIESLTREDGSVSTDETEIKGMVHNWCEKLFTSELISSTDVILEAIPSKVDAQMNVDLCKAYTNEEIKTALFQMGPTKAPGPDGFPAMFYQVHWELVENMVCEAVRSFFLGGDEIPDGFYDSVIVLIPKLDYFGDEMCHLS
ncbi:hypothetical protein QYE76_036681 [Lolium multiflorum]|uniref:DUF4283 domain-containing protein n=1 Tax=Lolium multiflorum TaxID=4521 RepID=A0AAD8VQF9_LOLMU|nr:hypothetical protein QYE76_036681 [Lolium multiflorum]